MKKDTDKKSDGKKLALRIVCFVLAVSMAASTVLYVIFSCFSEIFG